MLVSYKWLRELTGTKLSPEEIRDRLTNVGLAVDAVEARGDDFVLDVEVPSATTDLFQTGILDSQKFVELLLHLEKQFDTNINIEDFEFDNLRIQLVD